MWQQSMAEEKSSLGLPHEEPQEPDFAEMLTEGVRDLLGATSETAKAWRTSEQDPAPDAFRKWLAESLVHGGHRK
jgi:hypothetical protein